MLLSKSKWPWILFAGIALGSIIGIWRGITVHERILMPIIIFFIFLAISDYFKLHAVRNKAAEIKLNYRISKITQYLFLSISFCSLIIFSVFYNFALIRITEILNLTHKEFITRVSDTATILGAMILLYSYGKNVELKQIIQFKQVNQKVK